jgi:hypothetical protein
MAGATFVDQNIANDHPILAAHPVGVMDPHARTPIGEIIDLAKNGERNPDVLCDQALIDLRSRRLS